MHDYFWTQGENYMLYYMKWPLEYNKIVIEAETASTIMKCF